MKYLATLILFALLAFARPAQANVASPVCARIQDTGSFTFDGVNVWRFMGPICLMPDNSIQFLAWYTAGSRPNSSAWLTAGGNFPAFDALTCNWVTPTWTDLAPYMDPGPAHLCGEYTCTINYAGTYRVIGDGDTTGVRAGVVLRTNVGSVGHTYILAIKTVSNTQGLGACNLSGGPGSVNQFILLDQQPHCAN